MLDIIRNIARHWRGSIHLEVIEEYPDRFHLVGFDSPEPTHENGYISYLTLEQIKDRIELLQAVLKDVKDYDFMAADAKAFGEHQRYDYD